MISVLEALRMERISKMQADSTSYRNDDEEATSISINPIARASQVSSSYAGMQYTLFIQWPGSKEWSLIQHSRLCPAEPHR